MKFGAHCFLFTDHWSDASLPVLDEARELGLDCLEIAVGDDVTFSAPALKRHAEALEIELILSPGGEWPMACDITSEDASDRKAGLAWHKRQLDLAGEVGATAYTGAIYGHPGVVKRRRPPPEELRWAAAGLRELADYGASRSVTVAAEPMSHFRSHVINTPAQAMHLLELADHPNLEVLLDTYHMVTEVTDYAGAIHTVGDRLWGLHACENHRGVPGTGIVPWAAVFDALDQIAFDGHIILETYNSSIGDFAWRRGMFHDVCPDGRAFVREGLAFLKAGMGVAG